MSIESATTSDPGEALSRLIRIMKQLLAPDGCAWDREQTLETLRPYVIEEAFEVVDAIDRGEPKALCEELGDLLLQVVFQSELTQAKGWFHLNDVIHSISEKLIRRHPHVFDPEIAGKVKNAEEALRSWESQKAKEKNQRRSALEGVPIAMPALQRAVRLGEKASAVGYDWPDAQGARDKVNEELGELDEALRDNDSKAAQQEFGDVLFALASLGRKLKLDPEAALRGSLDRFTHRFSKVEEHIRSQNRELAHINAAELDELWKRAKEG